MQHSIVIAIDGLSSSGKSTLAKQLAAALNFDYIDSGAFYRAVTLYFIQNNIDWKNRTELKKALNDIQISFLYKTGNNGSETFLNGNNVEADIRSLEVSDLVSEISTISDVRRFIVEHLRKNSEGKNVVMDGRDIGTVVFPGAIAKIYLEADKKTRDDRRYTEMKQKGFEVTEHQIAKNISGRDLLDTTRSVAPLKKAEDALVLDNSTMTQEQQFDVVLKWINDKIEDSNNKT